MTRISLASAALLVAAATAAHAQTPAPAAAQPSAPQTVSLSAGVKRAWDGIKRNVAEAAEKMPDTAYGFQPTPDVRTFAGMVGHIAESQHSYCLRVKGEQVPFERGSIEKLTSKAELVKAMQASIAACDAVYGAATDESLVKLTKIGQAEVAPINILWGNISHSNEHYGNLVTYMRLKGLVPPSTERAQAPRKPSND